jgi:hypothetical protein
MADSYNILIQKLDQFIRKYYRNQLIKGTILFLATLFASFILVTIPEYFGHFAIIIRTLLFYFFLLLNAAVFIIFVVIPLMKIRKIGKIISHEQAAQIIGKHFGDIQDKLLNTLQLKKLADSGGPGTDLLIAGIEQKISGMKLFPFVSAIDLSRNRKFLKYAIPPLFIILLLLLISPSMVTKSSDRIIHHTRFYQVEAPFRMVVLNKKLEAFQQDDFVLKIKVTGEKLPDEVYVVANDASFKMVKESRNFFSYTFKSLQQSVAFHMEAGNIKSESYELHVYPKPTILNFQAELLYPGYLGRKNEILENTGDLIVPEGTTVKWAFYTKDVRTVLMNIDSIEKKAGNTEGNCFRQNFTFYKSGHYTVRAQNEWVGKPDSLNFTVTVIPDAFPSISVVQSQDSVMHSRLFYQGVIKDDYGFARLTFHYTIIQGSDTTKKEIKTENIPITKSLNQQQFFFSTEISQYLKNPGDEIDDYFEICDNDGIHGPKCTRSGSFRFKLPTLEEIEQQTATQEQNISKSLEQAIRDEKKVQKDIEDLKKKLMDKTTLSWQDKKQLQDILEKQKQIKETLDKIEKEDKSKNSLEQQFKNIDPSIIEKQKQLSDLFNQLMDEETKKMIDEIQKILDKVDKDQVNQMLEKMKMNNEDLDKQLDRSLDLFKQMEFQKNLSDMIDKLNQLAKKQDKLSEKSKDDKEGIDNLKDQQKDISKEFEDAKDKLDDLQKKNQELEEPNKFPNLEKSEENIKKDLENAMNELNKNNRKNSSKSQKSASDQMKSMAQQMKEAQDDMESEELTEDTEMLRQILENLVRISFRQEDIMNWAKLVNRNDPKYLKLIQDQNDLKEDLKMVEDSLYQLAKRQVMIKPFILREISSIDQNINDAVKFLNDRNLAPAISKQQFVMTSVNNLALMLSEVQEQMMKNLSACSKNKGKGSCSKPGGSGKASMSSLRKSQEAINKQLKELKDGLQSGRMDGKGKTGQQSGMNEKLARLAAQQEALRNEMQQYLNQLNEQGIKDGSGMSEAIRQMDQTEKDIVNRRILQETLDRQQQILTRMLESEKAEMQREQEEKRQSTEAKNQKYSNPSANFQYNNLRRQSDEIFKAVQPSYNYFYRNKINGYFLKFEQ